MAAPPEGFRPKCTRCGSERVELVPVCPECPDALAAAEERARVLGEALKTMAAQAAFLISDVRAFEDALSAFFGAQSPDHEDDCPEDSDCNCEDMRPLNAAGPPMRKSMTRLFDATRTANALLSSLAAPVAKPATGCVDMAQALRSLDLCSRAADNHGFPGMAGALRNVRGFLEAQKAAPVTMASLSADLATIGELHSTPTICSACLQSCVDCGGQIGYWIDGLGRICADCHRAYPEKCVPVRAAAPLPAGEAVEARRVEIAALTAIVELDTIQCGGWAPCVGPVERAMEALLPLVPSRNNDPDHFDAAALLRAIADAASHGGT